MLSPGASSSSQELGRGNSTIERGGGDASRDDPKVRARGGSLMATDQSRQAAVEGEVVMLGFSFKLSTVIDGGSIGSERREPSYLPEEWPEERPD